MAAERRIARRHKLEPIEICAFSSIDHLTLLSRTGHIVDASASGFLLNVKREDLVPKDLRSNLTLEAIEGDRIMLRIQQMNLEISGRIARTKLLGKQGFEIAIDFSDDAPEYWRECLVELLPKPGEME